MSVVILVDLQRVNSNFNYYVGFDTIARKWRIKRPDGRLTPFLYSSMNAAVRIVEQTLRSKVRFWASKSNDYIPNDFLEQESEEYQREPDIERPIDYMFKRESIKVRG